MRCCSPNVCEIDGDNVDTVEFLSAQHDLHHPGRLVSQAPVTDKAIKVALLPPSPITAHLSHHSVLLFVCLSAPAWKFNYHLTCKGPAEGSRLLSLLVHLTIYKCIFAKTKEY